MAEAVEDARTVTVYQNINGHKVALQARFCIECQKPVPWNREKYCCDQCMVRYLVRRWRSARK